MNQGQISFSDNLTPFQGVMVDETKIANEGHKEALKDQHSTLIEIKNGKINTLRQGVFKFSNS